MARREMFPVNERAAHGAIKPCWRTKLKQPSATESVTNRAPLGGAGNTGAGVTASWRENLITDVMREHTAASNVCHEEQQLAAITVRFQDHAVKWLISFRENFFSRLDIAVSRRETANFLAGIFKIL
jgi:hypothetical protein